MNIFNSTTKINEIRPKASENLDVTTTRYHFRSNHDLLSLPLTSVSPEITEFSSLEDVHDLKMLKFSFAHIAIWQGVFSSLIDVVNLDMP